MRKLFYMFIGLGLLMSCSTNPDADSPKSQSDASSEYKIGQDESNYGRLSKGTYNLSWVVDRQEIDTATLYVGDTPSSMRISHFPMGYFLNLVGKKVEPTEISYLSGESDWKLGVDVVGYSVNNAYLQNSTWAPQVWFELNGEDYSFLIYIENEESTSNRFTSVMYDTLKDMWSGAAPVYRFVMTNHATNECWDRTFPTPINMTFQTTGRKK